MKTIAKAAANIAALIVVSPMLLLYFMISAVADKTSVFATFSQWLSLLPGKLGSYIRAAFYGKCLTHCASDVVISFGTLLSQTDTSIESGVYIGPQCNIGSSHIEKDCLIGSGVHILSGKAQHALNTLDIPVREQGGKFVKIIVGQDSWIGNSAVVMASVGKHCVVGAGSVVTHPVKDYDIVSGNPAVVVRSRLDNNTAQK